jgi:hypothetical protein
MKKGPKQTKVSKKAKPALAIETSITASPTPELGSTARTTAEPATPQTPRTGLFAVDSPINSVTPSKRKDAFDDGSARKKLQKVRLES